MIEEDQLLLFDDEPFLTPKSYAASGSQRWIQVAVEKGHDLLHECLRPALKLRPGVTIKWYSPCRVENFREYRDKIALRRMGIHLPNRGIEQFWPAGGPMWDALGKTSDGEFIFLESKAHIAELFSPKTYAVPASQKLILKSLYEAQRHYLPSGKEVVWHETGFQYANRLAFHYLFRTLNNLPSHMVFLYFTKAEEVGGPEDPVGWRPGIRRLHRKLGLAADFHPPGVHHTFLDVEKLKTLPL